MKIMVYDGPKRLHIEEVPDPGKLGDEEVRIRTLYSGISHGTEMAIYRGVAPFFRRVQDPVTRLFKDANSRQEWKYPIRSNDPGVWYMGYSNVGEIVETGPEVRGLKVGDIVQTSAPHQSMVVMHRAGCNLLPAGLKPEYGVFWTNLVTAFNGILDTRIKLGDTVVVFGLGALGQMVAQLAKMNGAMQVIGVDALASRCKIAAENGADHVFDTTKVRDVAAAVRELTGGKGPDSVIEVSGNSRALNEAVRTAAFEGDITVISWYQGEMQGLNFSEEFHHNRPRIRASHTTAIDRGISNTWDMARRAAVCRELIGRLKFSNMATDIFDYDDAAAAYRAIDEKKADMLQAILKY